MDNLGIFIYLKQVTAALSITFDMEFFYGGNRFGLYEDIGTFDI